MTELPPLAPPVFTDTKPNPDYDGDQKVLRHAPKVPVGKPGAKPTGRVKPPPQPVKMPAKGVLKRAVMDIYGFAGMSLSMFRPNIAKVIVENAEDCAAAWEDLAETNESVRRVLLSLTKTSAWGGIILAHAPIALAIYSEINAPKVEPEDEADTDTEVKLEWSESRL